MPKLYHVIIYNEHIFQAQGIKFMWDSCFESVKEARKSAGSGCILAHCMGLGKTLQVIILRFFDEIKWSNISDNVNKVFSFVGYHSCSHDPDEWASRCE